MDLTIGVLGFVAVLVLGILRVPVAVAMAVVGLAGGAALGGLDGILYLSGTLPYDAVSPYGLSVVPLFVMMGVFAGRAGLSRALYDVADLLVGRFRGGLAMATIGASAGFGAICGSSLATCATIGKVALPEMRRHGYPDDLAAGAVAAGGTLGVLIPPSVIIVLYALITEQSIGALFAAALIPGLIATLYYMIAARISARRLPRRGERPQDAAQKRGGGLRLLAIADIVVLFGLVIGGIYAGLFSPTEAAAIGAGGAALLAWVRGGLKGGELRGAMVETALTSGMIFLILIGAALFNYFVETSGLPQALVGAIAAAGLGQLEVILLLVAFYLVLGCFMDSMSMVLLTVPAVFPLIQASGIDPIWFGILLVTVVELGLITPPIGMNLFVLKGIDARLDLGVVIRGVLPFIGADVVRVVTLIALPQVVLFLPHLLGF
ncbi:MAG: C4-dicarboxylate ABC transporter permease [Tistrella sp.]|uniref:TRAP transporter large permease protein n=1 Tax=Tistrella mobilis TaxID=171437 RepID=A0A3B9IGP9_9PROT|nr:TRAP transporter large permease [Tistrella sp.]MAD38994.1 C4-dicarboxylate ABC transporter permease [Tistrella sp.]MBA74775.1 C4-dicarboxylate ABC transporter permease [Tistrella sp.]HAE47041.1 C4-dicarboxylate ABC transporter permease [Tistrella mobilis]